MSRIHKLGRMTVLRLTVCLGCVALVLLSYVAVSNNRPRTYGGDHNHVIKMGVTPSAGRSDEDQENEREEDGTILNLGVARELGRREHGVVPIPCRDDLQHSEVMRMEPLQFLEHYKNPCWWERIETPVDEMYRTNAFSNYSFAIMKYFNKARDVFTSMEPPPNFRLRCLPYFLLAGQPKSGSTDLYNRLIAHPNIVTPPIKESHWWGKNRYGWCINFTATIPISDYVDLFDRAALQIKKTAEDTENGQWHPTITGDASVSTLWSNDDWWKNPENCGLTEPRYTNAHHVRRLLPNARIILIFRNPVDRLYSDFLYFQRRSKAQILFHESVKTAIKAWDRCSSINTIRSCIYNYTVSSKSRARLRLGLYHVYLEEWLEVFPRDQIFIIRLEDYSRKPLTTVREVYKFLGLKSLSAVVAEEILDQPISNKRRLSDKKLGKMLPATRTLLIDFYRKYNQQLANFLGDDRFLWDDKTE